MPDPTQPVCGRAGAGPAFPPASQGSFGKPRLSPTLLPPRFLQNGRASLLPRPLLLSSLLETKGNLPKRYNHLDAGTQGHACHICDTVSSTIVKALWRDNITL